MSEIEIESVETALALSDGVAAEFPKARSITFVAGDTWALKITLDGIISNPDVPIDEGAKAMIEAMQPYIRDLVRGANE